MLDWRDKEEGLIDDKLRRELDYPILQRLF
jgi:hypothetical protein